ncbi:MAG: aminopeptidase P family protein [Candidatus Omnitrophica bacterium]|nr:aminopeptidase P family protein [Candidatus Omnitrophota bacterium]
MDSLKGRKNNLMNLNKTEALLITSHANIYHFSKIDADGGVFLLLAQNQKFVFADSRFIKGAAKIAREFMPVATDKNNIDWWRNLLKKRKIKTIYFEPHNLTYYKLSKFRKMSRGLARLAPLKIDFQALRSQKNKQELVCIKKAVRITEGILKEINKIIRHQSKISEFDIMLEIYKQALNRGCDKLAFPPIVAFGKNTGIPHHCPSRFRRLRRGDMVLIDLGVKYKNFCADLTRTFFTAPPTSVQIEIYNKVLAVQSQVIKKIKAGAVASKLYDDGCTGFGPLAPNFTHNLGHGVGLEIHEYPNLKQKSPDILKSGQVLTIEPGLYFPWGGGRLEDMVAVNQNGCEVLTRFSKIF